MERLIKTVCDRVWDQENYISYMRLHFIATDKILWYMFSSDNCYNAVGIIASKKLEVEYQLMLKDE